MKVRKEWKEHQFFRYGLVFLHLGKQRQSFQNVGSFFLKPMSTDIFEVGKKDRASPLGPLGPFWFPDHFCKKLRSPEKCQFRSPEILSLDHFRKKQFSIKLKNLKTILICLSAPANPGLSNRKSVERNDDIVWFGIPNPVLPESRPGPLR